MYPCFMALQRTLLKFVPVFTLLNGYMKWARLREFFRTRSSVVDDLSLDQSSAATATTGLSSMAADSYARGALMLQRVDYFLLLLLLSLSEFVVYLLGIVLAVRVFHRVTGNTSVLIKYVCACALVCVCVCLCVCVRSRVLR